MDYKRILTSRENRKTRLARPYNNFFETFTQCVAAGECIISGNAPSQFLTILERTVVVSTVTAIEVYYRDMFDIVFRVCNPSFFEPKLKSLHTDKYDILDLLAVYDHKLHPLELVSSAQSFQNVDRIDSVFSKFLAKGLWSSILALQVRRKDNPSNVASWSAEDLAGLKCIFELRHELVHDPSNRLVMTDDIIKKMWQSAHMVFGSEVILGQMLAENSELYPSRDADDEQAVAPNA